jgi:[ribosomal protein S5]-alanine N-acetyltransferase
MPVITTPRLRLRPFADTDAPDVQRLACDRRIAETTLTIPHPYVAGMAEAWIATHEASWENGRGLVLAITLRETGELTGAMGMTLTPEHRSGELGYWMGVPYWGRGFATEAARALCEYGFRTLHLHRIHARHFVINPASGRVLEKLGMREEGVQRQAMLKWGRFVDVREFAILREEWERHTLSM